MNHRMLFLIALIITTSVGCNKESSTSPAGVGVQDGPPIPPFPGPVDEVRGIVIRFFSDTELTKEFVDSCIRVVGEETSVTISWEFELTQNDDEIWYLWGKPLGKIAGKVNPTVGDVLSCSDSAVIFTLGERQITLSNTVGFCLESRLVDSDTGETFDMNVAPSNDTPLTSGIVISGWAATKSKDDWLSDFKDSIPED